MDRDEALAKAASMYYLQEIKMEAIAKHLHTSRSTVSRLLRDARASGLVEISLRPTRTPSMGHRISAVFGIEAHVVPVPEHASETERLEQVSTATARMISTWFDSNMVLGVGWGTTISAVARRLVPKSTRGSAIVQLNGTANTRTSTAEHVGDLVFRFGKAFDAQVHTFPVPAFFDHPETRKAMWRERSVERVLDIQRRTDLALFSVGSVSGNVPSRVVGGSTYSAGYLDEDDLTLLEAEGVVGDVCTIFLRSDGNYRDLALNERASGLTPAELRRIPRRVCVVVGNSKRAPLVAALRAGIITHLIIDEITAAELTSP